jgi:hypothetical protein
MDQFMPIRFCIFCYCIVLSMVAGMDAAPARPAQDLDNAQDLCAAATARQERMDGIPSHLLRAISLAETGRWDAVNRVNLAWPWTVTAKGEGRYFDTKAAAVAEVMALKSQGIRNIDVGCMQVNLFYHADAFPSLEDALDPASNVAYAAGFLKNLRVSQGSWTRAAGAYHSKNPNLGSAYRSRVMRLWSQARDVPVNTPSDIPTTTPPGTVATVVRGAALTPAIDRVRTAQLNSRLESTRAAARNINDAASIRQRQLAAWREDRVRADTGNHLALMRRAEAKMLRRQVLQGTGEQKVSFADKRRAQLLSWRRGLVQPTF